MYRIDNSSAVANLLTPSAPGPAPNSYFNDQGSTRTILDAEWLDMVQEEISNCVDNQGALAPLLTKQARNQLLMAIRREVLAGAGTAGGGGGVTSPVLPPLKYQTAVTTTPVNMPVGSGMAIYTVTQANLTPGDWEMWGEVSFNCNALVNYLGACIGTDNTNWVSGYTGRSTQLYYGYDFSTTATTIDIYAGHCIARCTQTPHTTVYLTARADFPHGIMHAAAGFLAFRYVGDGTAPGIPPIENQ